MTHKKVLLTVCLAFTLGLTGCSTKGADDIGFGGSPSKQCVHMNVGDRVLIGETLAAKQQPVDLKSVELLDATGVEVKGTWVLPIRAGGAALGVSDVPPPSSIRWSERRRVDAFSVPANSEYNLVLEIEKNSSILGRATAIQVQGSTDGSPFTAQATTSYTFPTRCF